MPEQSPFTGSSDWGKNLQTCHHSLLTTTPPQSCSTARFEISQETKQIGESQRDINHVVPGLQTVFLNQALSNILEVCNAFAQSNNLIEMNLQSLMNSVRLDGKRMKCSSSTREKLLHLKYILDFFF